MKIPPLLYMISNPPSHHTNVKPPKTVIYSLPNLQRTPRPLQSRTRIIKVRLGTIEEIIPPNAGPIAHTPKDAPPIVQIDRRIELGDVPCIHDQDSIVPNLGALANDPFWRVVER